MIKTNTEKITVDDDGSISSISDLDVKAITTPMLQRQESTGYCPHKLEMDRPMSPIFDSNIKSNDQPFVIEPSPNSIQIPKLRRERQSDYGHFDSYFEDDVINWFQYIDKKKKIEIIHTLVDMVYYDHPYNMKPTYYADSPIPKMNDNIEKLGSSYPELSIKLDDVEDISETDIFLLGVKENKEN